METAKDIIDRHIASTDSFMVAFEKAAAEIADKAWEASFQYYIERINNLERGVHATTAPGKPTFMKSLFPETK